MVHIHKFARSLFPLFYSSPIPWFPCSQVLLFPGSPVPMQVPLFPILKIATLTAHRPHTTFEYYDSGYNGLATKFFMCKQLRGEVVGRRDVLRGCKKINNFSVTVYIKACSSLTHNKIVLKIFVVLQNMLGITF